MININLTDDLELISRILSLIPGYVAIQDKDGKFLCANAKTITELGFDNFNQIYQCHPKNLPCPVAEINEEIVAHIRSVIAQDCPTTTLSSIYSANNQWGFYISQQHPLRDCSNQIIGVITHGFAINHAGIANQFLATFLENKGKGQARFRQGIYKCLNSQQQWNLSPRQGECFFWLLQRKTPREISCLLGLSKRTIEFYIQLIKSKFNVKTISELIETAEIKELSNYIPEQWCVY